jgi:subtilisin family serine protease
MRTSAPRAARLFAALATVVIALTFGSPASSQAPRPRRLIVLNGHEAVAGEVLIRLRDVVAAAERGQLEQQLDADESRELGHGLGLQRIHSRSFDVRTLLAFLRTHPSVAYVEPNYVLRTAAAPAETQFASQWALQNLGQSINGAAAGTTGADIHAIRAWDVSTGTRANVVGVIDTGIDYSHADLSANVWTAPAAFTVTIGGTPITCAAGTHGFNAITRTCDPRDDNDHGSHVSGTIGAAGNNSRGVAGVNWTTSIMASKFLDATGYGTLSDAIDAIEFTIQAKAAFASSGAANVRVLNNSWGGGGFSQALLDEINKAGTNGMLFVAAAGNNATDNDTEAAYPANYTSSGATNVVSVAATDNNDQLASFSNYGRTQVHLGAPGVNILSTTRGNTYRYFSGTSMATPHVTGAAALVLSRCALTTGALRNAILHNVDVIGALTGWVTTNGRLNVDKALRSCATASAAPVAPDSAPVLTAIAGNAQVKLSWTASTGAASYIVHRKPAGGTFAVIKSGVTSTGYTNTGLTNGTTYYYTVSAVANGVEGPASRAIAAQPVARPAVPVGVTASSGPGPHQISIAWTATPYAATYRVKRSAISGGPFSTLATGIKTAGYVDSTAHAARRYYYVVSAMNVSGESANSSQATAVAK